MLEFRAMNEKTVVGKEKTKIAGEWISIETRTTADFLVLKVKIAMPLQCLPNLQERLGKLFPWVLPRLGRHEVRYGYKQSTCQVILLVSF